MHYIEPSQDIRALCEKFAVLMKKLDSAEKDKVDLNDQLNDCHQSIKQLDSQHTREVYGKDVEVCNFFSLLYFQDYRVKRGNYFFKE